MQALFNPAVIVPVSFISISSISLWFVLYQGIKQQGRDARNLCGLVKHIPNLLTHPGGLPWR